MAVLSSEMLLYKSSVISNDPLNGNVISDTLVINGALNGVFENVSPAELIAGKTQLRKLFRCNRNPTNQSIGDVLLYNTPTGADTYVRVFAGTDSDVEGGLTGSETRYGTGLATADILVAATAISLTTEGPGGDIFRIGDMVVIRDTTASNFEVAEILTVTVNTPTSTDITLTAGTSGSYALASSASVSSAIEVGVLNATATSVAVTSVSGTYDDVGSPITASNAGGVIDTWTVTFTTAVDFTVAGATTGAVGGGNTSGDFAPNNPGLSAPYFTLLASGFGGTFAALDTLIFSTTSSCSAFWAELVVPAGTAGQALPDSVSLCSYGA
jgi:hypothetical protein